MLKRTTMPLYHQLRELLTGKIENGEWEPGHRLPTESQLMIEFGVSRATVRQAMQLLENQGLVERVQGLGTFVGRPKVANDLLSLWILEPDKEIKIRLSHLKTIEPPPSLAVQLALPAGEKAYELQRIVFVEEEPLMMITSWLPCFLFPGLENRPLDGVPIRRTVESYFSLVAFHQHKEVEITIVDEGEASGLNINPGAPALLFTYLNRLAGGRPFEYRKMIVRGDRCKYYADLDMPEPLI